tara:strand:+ start:432 stop:602 length:171 start_codon:yes stop_codon:yes gene_type:complete
MSTLRLCNKCKVYQDKEEFWRSGPYKTNVCKKCRNEKVKNYNRLRSKKKKDAGSWF